MRDDVYPAIYYQTIRDTGIDPVVCGDMRVPVSATLGREGESSEGRSLPVQLADKALAKASGATSGAPRKRAPRKATGARAASGTATKSAKMTNAAKVPAKAARGTAKVATAIQ